MLEFGPDCRGSTSASDGAANVRHSIGLQPVAGQFVSLRYETPRGVEIETGELTGYFWYRDNVHLPMSGCFSKDPTLFLLECQGHSSL